MPVVTYRTFHTRGVYLNMQSFRNEIRKTMDSKINPLIESDLQEIAQDLNLQLDFSPTTEITPDRITVTFTPQGTGAHVWNWVSQGTEDHWIPLSQLTRPTRRGYKGYKPSLLLARYSPKTSPTLRGSFGGVGKYTTTPVYRQKVHHPGIKPRYLERSVAYNVRKDFYSILENALRRAVRRAQKEGS